MANQTPANQPSTTNYPPLPEGLSFKASSTATGSKRVEVAPLPDGGAVIRDPDDPGQLPLIFDAGEWRDFVAGVKNDEFDFLAASVSPNPETNHNRT